MLRHATEHLRDDESVAYAAVAQTLGGPYAAGSVEMGEEDETDSATGRFRWEIGAVGRRAFLWSLFLRIIVGDSYIVETFRI